VYNIGAWLPDLTNNSRVGQDFFKPYYADLQSVADTLHKYPMVTAIITGGADGERYRQNNDAQNPALALGRAHVLHDLLMNKFNVDSTQLVIQSEDVKTKGARYRYASVRISPELYNIEKRLGAVENRPPLEKHFTEVQEITNEIEENLGLHLSVGLSSSPFGGIPVVACAFSWKKVVYVEGIVGHTFWNSSFTFEGNDLDTKRRLVGGYLIYYPYNHIPVGIVGGWVRIEEISQEYYEYVKLSDGPVLGLRGSPHKFISITGAYNPSKHRITGNSKSKAENDQFLISITAHMRFGGKK
jgi:hypothetical protein